jgi:glycerophosphoryl diester phosphodiesterase
MEAFRRAVEVGAGFIDTDLHLTRDGSLVAVHDPTLDRTTNGRGLVENFTLSQLRELDACSWFSPEFAGERVPTLDEILAFARETDVVFYLELKADASLGAEHTLGFVLRNTGGAKSTVVLSFDPAVLSSVRRIDSTLLTGLLLDAPSDDAVERALRVGARQLLPRGDLVTAELLARAHEEGLTVVAWTINEPAEMRALIEAGVDGIMSDYPGRLRSL